MVRDVSVGGFLQGSLLPPPIFRDRQDGVYQYNIVCNQQKPLFFKDFSGRCGDISSENIPFWNEPLRSEICGKS